MLVELLLQGTLFQNNPTEGFQRTLSRITEIQESRAKWAHKEKGGWDEGCRAKWARWAQWVRWAS
jgi:hypothetical protein